MIIPKRIIPVRPGRVLALVAFLCVPLLPARAEDPRPPQQSAAEKIKQRQQLDESFKSLEEELKAALPEYTKLLQEAQKKGVPRDQWPKSPVNDFYARFESLALQDQPDSLRWCLGVMSSLDVTIDERVSKKDALYKRYVASSVDTQFTGDVITFLLAEASPEGLGVDRAAALLDQISKTASKADIRAQAAWTKGQAYSRSAKPEHKELAIATYKALITAYPKSTEASQARTVLFQLEHLQVGMVAPEVTTSDLDGNAFKLSDSRGKITVILFFGTAHRMTPQMLTAYKELAAGLKDKPFTIIGVPDDEKKDDLKKTLTDAGVDWKMSWQGGRTGPWISEWGVARIPTVYVLDDKGVIRHVNPEFRAMKKLVDDLFAEIEARKKEPK
jgi:peroxiredoxin